MSWPISIAMAGASGAGRPSTTFVPPQSRGYPAFAGYDDALAGALLNVIAKGDRSGAAMQPSDLFLDGRRIEAGWWGERSAAAPCVVLLHEGLGSLRLWGGFPARLAEASGLAVFGFSRFGYGASDPVTLPRPLDYMEREARDVLPHVLEAAGVGHHLLVGHSDGASIAAIAAGMRPEAPLAGLVLMAPHFFVEELSIASIAAAREAYAAGDLRARLAAHHADVEVAFRGWNDAWLDPGFRSWAITRYLPAIRAPVLLIQGEADPYGTIAQIRAAERLISGPVQTLMLAGVGHDPAREARDATVDAIAHFARAALGAAPGFGG